ncbi:MAG TPA: right-handed parallel beta-helix repeat-containing protein [Mucilaginibacter sp.]|jgi:hypothetical protein|nr:right-handed parallel beta-helix repeat-containing protein [Mucilaginibacter sp.]
MKKQLLALLSVGVLLWSSCSKTDISPNTPSALSTNFHAKTLATFTASSPINLNGSHDITISGKSINGGTVPAITLSNCYNVHITANSLGNSSDVGIYLYNCYNITIDNNFVTNVAGGVYVDHSTGGGIIVTANQFLNMQGPAPRGQFVQFNTVSGGNNSITYNKCQNILGQSSSQEGINLYKSNGSASSPILVDNNWIEGGGPNSASGGIQLGDNGGSYEVASNNILVNPGQMGISISGGDHHSVINNTIYAGSQSFTNVGLVVWGQAGYAVTNSTVSGNKVNFKSSTGAQNDYWLASGEYTPSGWNTNNWKASVDASVLPATIVSNPATATAAVAGPSPATTAAVVPVTTTSSSGVINLNGAHDMTISGKTISGGNVSCIKLTNCYNIYITKCNLSNSTANGIELSNCTNVTMEANNISNVASGIVASNCPSGSINAYSNQMRNMTGPYGSFVQFSAVNGSNNISYNKLENITGASNGEIAIQLIQCYGTSGSPINLNGNWIRGGGPSGSSGGINLGDQGGAYQIAQNNILVDPGQHGMAIVGGDHISMINNSIYARAQSFTNVGLYVWGQGGHAITNSTVSGNQVNFANAQGVQNSVWLAGGEYTPAGWSTNAWGANINSSILPTTMLSF